MTSFMSFILNIFVFNSKRGFWKDGYWSTTICKLIDCLLNVLVFTNNKHFLLSKFILINITIFGCVTTKLMNEIQTHPLTTSKNVFRILKREQPEDTLKYFVVSFLENKTIYLPGQRVDGFVSAMFNSPTSVKTIRVKLSGLIHSSESFSDSSIPSRSVLFKVIPLKSLLTKGCPYSVWFTIIHRPLTTTGWRTRLSILISNSSIIASTNLQIRNRFPIRWSCIRCRCCNHKAKI